MTSFLKRVEGAGREFFGGVGAEPGDVIILISTSGRNSFPIEMAIGGEGHRAAYLLRPQPGWARRVRSVPG
jgi:uncharacterized phosphosugar-binding protein